MKHQAYTLVLKRYESNLHPTHYRSVQRYETTSQHVIAVLNTIKHLAYTL